MKNIVILISGRGSNMIAIEQAIRANKWNAKIACVISNQESAAGLDYAKSVGIVTQVLSHKAFSSRDSYDAALINVIDQYHPDIVVLAGFMRILTPQFVNHYLGKMVNIHPSLLPSFTGLHTHERAIDYGVKVHGATVHFVTEELDGGPIIAQAIVPVLTTDDANCLAARVLKEEHKIFPMVVRWLIDDMITYDRHLGVVFKDSTLQAQSLIISEAFK